MLSFVDNRKALLIFRSEEQGAAGVGATKIGAIQKNTFEVVFEPDLQISAADRDEVREVCERLKLTRNSAARSSAWRFPELAREITEYYRLAADDIEKRLIATALDQALRSIRRHERSLRAAAVNEGTSLDLVDIQKRMIARLREAQAARSAGAIERANANVEAIVRDTPKELRGERWYDVAVARSSGFRETLERSREKRRIYIVGCGRSGTWFTLGMMSTFEGVYITPDERHFGHFAAIAERTEPVHVVKRMFDAHLDFDTAPDCIDILYVLRDPRDVMTSRHVDTERYISLQRWSDEMTALKRLLSSGRQSLKIVRFEDLATTPDKVQAELAGEFGLEVAHHANNFHRTYQPTAGAVAAMHSLRPPDPSTVGRWRRDSDQADFVNQMLPEIVKVFAPLGERFGYDLSR